jgi:hypothetical protein
MTVTPAEETVTTPKDTGNSLWHLACTDAHPPSDTARCGYKRKKEFGGWVTAAEAESKGYCVVCVDLAKNLAGHCDVCRPNEGTP